MSLDGLFLCFLHETSNNALRKVGRLHELVLILNPQYCDQSVPVTTEVNPSTRWRRSRLTLMNPQRETQRNYV